MRDRSEDNSLRDLSFDFLGVFGTANGADADRHAALVSTSRAIVPEENVTGAIIPEHMVTDEEAPTPAAPGAGTGIVSAGRRRVWGAVYALRTVAAALVVACVGSLVLTMALNPELTLSAAVALMVERAGDLILRARGFFA